MQGQRGHQQDQPGAGADHGGAADGHRRQHFGEFERHPGKAEGYQRQVQQLRHGRRTLLVVVVGGRLVHQRQPIGRYAHPRVEFGGEGSRTEQQRQPYEVNHLVGRRGHGQVLGVALQRSMGRGHVAGAADPAAGKRSEGLPAVLWQREVQWPAFRRGNGLTQGKSQKATDNHADAAEQHHENAFAHDARGAQYVHLDQHQADENRQAVIAQKIVGGVLVWDQPGIGQHHRCGVDEDQRRQVVEQLPAALLFQPEPETDDRHQDGHDACRRGNQGTIHLFFVRANPAIAYRLCRKSPGSAAWPG